LILYASDIQVITKVEVMDNNNRTVVG